MKTRMTTRMWMIAAGAALAMAFALALPSLTLAYGPGVAARGGAGGRGMGMGGGQGESLVAVAAQVLGIPQADLVAQLQAGKTIREVAGEKAGAIVDAFVKPRAERLAAQVAAGRLTQAQADQMLAVMRSNVAARLGQTWDPRGAGDGQGYVDSDGDGVCDSAGAAGGAGMGRGHMGRGQMGRGR